MREQIGGGQGSVMGTTTFFLTPGACSRVSLTALEHVGASYDAVMIDLASGEQRGPGYLAVNPRGKTPALVADGELLTENVAIVSYLHMLHPAAGLFPAAETALRRAQQLSYLTWIQPGGMRTCAPT